MNTPNLAVLPIPSETPPSSPKSPRVKSARVEAKPVKSPRGSTAQDDSPNRPLASETDLLLARFRLRARRRSLWLQHLWSEEGEPGGRDTVTHAELAAILADRDSPEAEAAWRASIPEWPALDHELARIETALREFPQSRLDRLASVFGLSSADLDLFQACAAIALDPTLARACAYLHDHAGRTGVSEDLTARLYDHGRCGVWPAESPLFRWELVVPREISTTEPRLLVCDPQLRDWLLGKAVLSELLTGAARLHPPLSPLAS